MLDVERNAGITLTESFAMYPTAAVSGWYFSHPEATYFAVGKIDADQVADYARRKGMTLAEAERWLAPVDRLRAVGRRRLRRRRRGSRVSRRRPGTTLSSATLTTVPGGEADFAAGVLRRSASAGGAAEQAADHRAVLVAHLVADDRAGRGRADDLRRVLAGVARAPAAAVCALIATGALPETVRLSNVMPSVGVPPIFLLPETTWVTVPLHRRSLRRRRGARPRRGRMARRPCTASPTCGRLGAHGRR